MTPQLTMTLLAIGIFGAAFWLGWDISVRRFNADRRKDKAYLRRLENDIDALAEQLDSDAARSNIDTGKEYVLFRVQATLDDIRSESR